MLDVLTGDLLRSVFTHAGRALERNKEAINALNVFPVPDGDTGTNLCMTMASAISQVQSTGDVSVGDVAKAAAFGSLMGARGNSGVILSQILRGMSNFLASKTVATPMDFARALQQGVATAYKAVMKPVEGTMLTVAREAANKAVLAAQNGGDLAEVLKEAYTQAQITLEKTPEMLSVLKQAGVVDAGGKGFVCFLEGALNALIGPGETVVEELPPQPETVPELVTPGNQAPWEASSAIAFPYDTQFLIHGSHLDAAEVRRLLTPMGDSLVVAGSDDLLKVHIHTANPAPVLDACLKIGELSQIHIENMRHQHEEYKRRLSSVGTAMATGNAGHDHSMNSSGNAFSSGAMGIRENAGVEFPHEKELAVVAVASGAGLRDVFTSLGADLVINGGQTMNPSTEDVLLAVNQVKARRVIFLPNNSNIFLAAKQAKKLTDKKVYVVPSKTVPQGLAALVALQPNASMEANLKRMAKAISGVTSGEVTYAVRESVWNNIPIKAGDILGMLNGDIKVVGNSPEEVLQRLVRAAITPVSEILTVFWGEMVREDTAKQMQKSLEVEFCQLEIEVRYGGQPVYYYLFSLE